MNANHGRLLASALLAAGTSGAGSQAVAGKAQPTVVELFQSQGCSDCPPANANVMALSDRADLLTLSFGVTYWDRLEGHVCIAAIHAAPMGLCARLPSQRGFHARGGR